MRLLITGGAGFIGSAVVRKAIGEMADDVLVLDKLTYAGNLASLAPVGGQIRAMPFVQRRHLRPRGGRGGVRAISPEAGSCIWPPKAMSIARSTAPPSSSRPMWWAPSSCLSEALAYWRELKREARETFRFHPHLDRRSVRLAGRRGSVPRGHALSAQFALFGLQGGRGPSGARLARTLTACRRSLTNCSNNYGPYHFPEKLIPLTILNAVEGKPLPVYGRGENIRDWLYVEDHAAALLMVARAAARSGETYNVGGRSERRNIEVVQAICDILDEIRPKPAGSLSRADRFVADRPGHDARYAIDASKIERELGWRPRETFETGLRKTVRWYLDNPDWWGAIRSGRYRGERLGLNG